MPMCGTQNNAAPPQPANAMPLLGGSVFFIGLRYLLAKKLSYLAMAGVMISVATLIVVMSVMTGFSEKLRKVIRGYLSDVTVESKTAKLYSMDNWQEVAKKVTAVEHVTHAAPFIEGYALMRFVGSGHMDHIVFRGIVPELEKEVTAINTYLIKGTRPEHLEMTLPDPDPESPPGAQVQCCFVGNAMAEFAKLPFPDYTAQIVLVTVTPDLRRPRIRKYLINGVFKTGRYDYDRSVVILSLENAMELVDSRGGVSGLSLRLDNYRNATEVIKTLQDKLGPDYILTTWEQKQQNFLEAVAMEWRWSDS